ncbi:MAG: hypothetical protein K2U26_19695 [Cyclobacteriaceae bacterium]|nr:hypothetical protein [Cyclobacteriaceae bacterium]
MIRSAYNTEDLYKLGVVKDAQQWWKSALITEQQFQSIKDAYKNELYHPNILIRVLLFVATLIALSGVSGLFFLMVGSTGEAGISFASIVYGLGSFVVLEQAFIAKRHYKSGVNEAILYHALGFTIGGLGGLTDFSMHVILIACIAGFTFAAIRYIDLLSTLAAVLSLAGWVFFECYNLGGVAQLIIPFVIIVVFAIVYAVIKRLKKNSAYALWENNFIVVESVSLLLIYLGGNYLVVRELSIELMGLALEPGQDIPFAYVFYFLTVMVPIVYLLVGIKKKDVVLLRVSLVLVAISVFTFKYYYGFGHPEITLTVAGALVLGISLALMNYLKEMRNGFTRENILSENWSNANLAAFVISQTMGGNQPAKSGEGFKGGGGEYSGGGSSGGF